jgi:uncharacterized repeat protein (TIGR03803 family)
MKLSNRKHLALFVLVGAALSLATLRGEETVQTLVSFTGPNGAYPGSIVQGPDGSFYGTTYSGGAHDKGTLFVIPQNKPLKTIVTFDGTNGSNPESELVVGPDGSFFGTTYKGGAHDKGTIFEVTPDGVYKTLARTGRIRWPVCWSRPTAISTGRLIVAAVRTRGRSTAFPPIIS